MLILSTILFVEWIDRNTEYSVPSASYSRTLGVMISVRVKKIASFTPSLLKYFSTLGSREGSTFHQPLLLTSLPKKADNLKGKAFGVLGSLQGSDG